MTEYAISYGKTAVPVYRRGAAPLRGVRTVPGSGFSGRDNALVAARVSVEVLGDNFLPAYTEGDNSMVVATDSIKNLILRETGSWTGATLESLLHHLGARLLADYAQMAAVRVSAEEIRFDPAGPRGTLHARAHGDATTARLDLTRSGDGVALGSLRSGRRDIELLKLTGSAFTAFVRDDYTTLPERRDRPLWIGLDVGWRYRDPADALGAAPQRYIAGEQVRDVCAGVFEDLVSESIQHLVHAMGVRLLELMPELSEVSFEARNLTRDPVVEGVHTDPFPAHGTISLTMRRG
jgi:urate oxidase / 2-oxo-4-hydroxy-4-carboxy-5-ureidoimidazoline decarboxylase